MALRPQNRTWWIALAFAIVYVVWGSTYLAILYAIETVPPFLMAGVRFTIAGAVLYGLVRLRGEAQPTRPQFLNAAIIGTLLLVGGNGLVVWAEQTVASGMASLLIATVPLWMVMLDWAIFGGRRPTALVLSGLTVGTAGIALLIGPADLKTQQVNPWGAAALLAACFFWSLGSLRSRKIDMPKSAFLSVALQMIAAGAILLVIGTVNGDWTRLKLDAVSAKSLISMVYLIVFGSMIALSAYVWLLRVCSAASVATYAYVNPIVAVLLGYFFAGEPITGRTLIAAGLIVVAVVLVTISKSPKPSTTEESPESKGRSSDESPIDTIDLSTRSRARVPLLQAASAEDAAG